MKPLPIAEDSQRLARGRRKTNGFSTKSPALGADHSEDYHNAMGRVMQKLACTDLRELFRLIPDCFEGVAGIEIVVHANRHAFKISASFEKNKFGENQVVFVNQPRTEEPLDTMSLSVEHSPKCKRLVGQMSIYGSSQNLGVTNQTEERDILKMISSLIAKTIDARLDGLTALPVRRYFDLALEEELNVFVNSGRNFSVVLLDVDDFKEINDRYGHPAGDSILTEIAYILYNGIRARPDSIDSVFRYGGEEFALLLKGVSRDEAIMIAERLRAEMEAHAFQIPDNKGIGVTCSFGVADVQGIGDADDLRGKIIKAADGNLYQAKERGKNRVNPPPA